MVDNLDSKMISLVLTVNMQHGSYSEVDDVYTPLVDYYKSVFDLDLR